MSNNTIEISSGRDLQKIEENPKSCFILKDDIVFKRKTGLLESLKPGFMKDYTNYYGFGAIDKLEGTLDGNGHTIKNFTLSPHNLLSSALIKVNKGTIKNLNLEDVFISASSSKGGLVARNRGEIKNCYVQGEIKNKRYGASGISGGIVAHNKGGKIINCRFEGLVKSNEFSGGICGKNYEGKISECEFSGGKVSGEDCVGGIVGYNKGGIYKSQTSGVIRDNTGGSVGGIAGKNKSEKNNHAVEFCYSDSELSYGNGSVGGLIGYNSGNLKNSYFCGSINQSNINRDVGIIAGINTGLIENCYWTPVDYSGEIDATGERDYLGSMLSNVDKLDEKKNFKEINSLIIADKI